MRRRISVPVLLVASPVAAWFFGVALPHGLIDPGVEDLDGAEARMAQAALIRIDASWGTGPLESTKPTVAKRVTRVQKCPGTPDGEAFEELVSMAEGYSAEVEIYTYFGIPYGTATIDCGGEAPGWNPG